MFEQTCENCKYRETSFRKLPCKNCNTELRPDGTILKSNWKISKDLIKKENKNV